MSAIANHTIGFSRKLGSASTTGFTAGFGGDARETAFGAGSTVGAGGVWVETGVVPDAVLAVGDVVSVGGTLA
jgi:hypothetical protein